MASEEGGDGGGGIWMIGVAQPIWPAASKPGYDGTMMTPLEQQIMANTVSTGLNRLPMVIDHAGFSTNEGGQEPRTDQIIGHAVDAWRDPKQGLMILAHIPEERVEGGRFVRDVLQRGETYGFSLYTDSDVKGGDLTTGEVVNLTVRHVGLTKRPAWGKEGTMVHEFSDQPYTIRQVIRDKYLPVEGAHFHSETLRRLAETEASDRKLIDDSRAERLTKERRTLSYSTFAMASAASDAKAETAPAPPAVDAMKVDPPATEPATKAAAPATHATAAGLPQPTKESIRQMDDYMKQWGIDLSSALSVQNLQDRWEKTRAIKKTIGDTMQGTPYGTLAWIDAGVGKYLDRIKQEDAVLVDRPLDYANRQWKAGKMTDVNYRSVQAGLTLATLPSGSAEDIMTLPQCRLICAPVRAAADDELQSQKDVEVERERVKAEQLARMNVEKEYDSTKRKLADMEKQIEQLKAQSESFKAFTPEKAAASLAQTPVPKAEAPDDAVSKAAAISVQAAENRRLKGTWGTDDGIKEYLRDAWGMRGDSAHHMDVLKMPEGMRVRRVPGAVPHLEFGEDWTF
jgi:hypothetical protein